MKEEIKRRSNPGKKDGLNKEVLWKLDFKSIKYEEFAVIESNFAVSGVFEYKLNFSVEIIGELREINFILKFIGICDKKEFLIISGNSNLVIQKSTWKALSSYPEGIEIDRELVSKQFNLILDTLRGVTLVKLENNAVVNYILPIVDISKYITKNPVLVLEN